MIKLTVTENQANQRLDRFLKKYFDRSSLSLIYKMIRKDVKVNGKRAKEDRILELGDELSIYMDEESLEKLKGEKTRVKALRQFKIAYEDENLLIAEKPFGLLTHGDRTEKKNHLANQVIDYLIEKGDYDPRLDKTFTPSPANRLDRNTTGLVVFGKNGSALRELNRMIREKDALRKKYLTIVAGTLKTPLHLRDKMVKDGERNLVTVLGEDEEGKTMETVAIPLAKGTYKGQPCTLVEVEIITGRTHQIRAHLAKSGYPVIGDAKYGRPAVNRWASKEFSWTTQLLHAYKLEFSGPKDVLAYMEGKTVEAGFPDDFERIKGEIFG